VRHRFPQSASLHLRSLVTQAHCLIFIFEADRVLQLFGRMTASPS